MSSSKIDLSLQEVIEWQEKLWSPCEPLSKVEQGAYIHQKAMKFMQKHNLHLVTVNSHGRNQRQPPRRPSAEANRPKMEDSLAEVRDWREKSQVARTGMSVEEQGAYIHQKALDFMRRHNLNLVMMDSRGRQKL
jgi:nucleotide-binding universal stress UspA family protein